MKKNLTKIINLVLVFVMVLTNISVMTTAAYAAGYVTYETVTEAEVLERLDYIINNVYPCHTKYGKRFDGGSTCYGFGKDVIYRLFGAYTSYRYRSFTYSGVSTSGMDIIASCTTFTFANVENLLSNAKPGDVLQFDSPKQHTMIIKSVNSNSVTVYHSNWDNKDTVRIDTFSFDYFINRNSNKLSLLRSNNYNTFGTNVNRVALYETAKVTAKTGLTIRKNPDINSARSGYLFYNQTVNVCNFEVTDNSGYKWRRLLDGKGWVCSNYLKITGGQSFVSGDYKIQCSNGKFLTYTNKPANDTNIVLYDDLYKTSISNQQIWNFKPLYYYSDSGVIVYQITPAVNSKYSLDCDATNNELLHLWQSLNIEAQQWIVEVCPDGSIKLLNNATRYALTASANHNNSEVITYTVNNSNGQKFYLVSP